MFDQKDVTSADTIIIQDLAEETQSASTVISKQSAFLSTPTLSVFLFCKMITWKRQDKEKKQKNTTRLLTQWKNSLREDHSGNFFRSHLHKNIKDGCESEHYHREVSVSGSGNKVQYTVQCRRTQPAKHGLRNITFLLPG